MESDCIALCYKTTLRPTTLLVDAFYSTLQLLYADRNQDYNIGHFP